MWTFYLMIAVAVNAQVCNSNFNRDPQSLCVVGNSLFMYHSFPRPVAGPSWIHSRITIWWGKLSCFVTDCRVQINLLTQEKHFVVQPLKVANSSLINFLAIIQSIKFIYFRKCIDATQDITVTSHCESIDGAPRKLTKA